MAKQQAGNLFSNIGNQTNPLDSQAYKSNQSNLYNAAQASIQDGSFTARHPVMSGIGAALLGGLVMGPAGLATFPMLNNNREQKRQAGISEAYRTTMKDMAEIENNLNAPRTNANIGNTTSTLLENQGIQSPITANTPINNEFSQTVLNGTTGMDTYNQLLDDQNSQLKKTWNMGAGVADKMINRQPPKQAPGIPTPPQSQSMPPMPQRQMDTSEQAPVFGAQAIQQAPPEISRLATYTNPALLQTGLTANASVLNNTFQNVPAYMKLPSDIKAKLQEAALNQAKTVTEGYRPAQVQAETEATQELGALRGRTDPNLRAPNVIDLMNPEQRQQYAGTVAAGKQGQFSASEAMAEVELSNIANDTSGKVTPEVKAAASSALQRLRGQNGVTNGAISNGQTARSQKVLQMLKGQ